MLEQSIVPYRVAQLGAFWLKFARFQLFDFRIDAEFLFTGQYLAIDRVRQMSVYLIHNLLNLGVCPCAVNQSWNLRFDTLQIGSDRAK